MRPVKELLRQYKQANREVDRIEWMLEEAQENAEGSAINYDGLPKGTMISKPTETSAVNISDIRRDLSLAKSEATWRMFNVYSIIGLLKNEDAVLHDILFYTYIWYDTDIDKKSKTNQTQWDVVAGLVGYSTKQTTRLHGQALDMLEQLIN